MSSAPAVLAVDPAAATGLAMLLPDGSVWAHTLKPTPRRAADLATVLAWVTEQMPWHAAPEWHLVIERMFGGENVNTSIISAELAGQLYQEIGRMREWASVAKPYASQWRTIFPAGTDTRRREDAKRAALAYVAVQWPDLAGAVDDNAAEACCMALWRQRELEHAAKALRLGIGDGIGPKRRRKGAGRGKAQAAAYREAEHAAGRRTLTEEWSLAGRQARIEEWAGTQATVTSPLWDEMEAAAAEAPERGLQEALMQFVGIVEQSCLYQGISAVELAQKAGLPEDWAATMLNAPQEARVGTLVRIANAVGRTLSIELRPATKQSGGA